MEFYGGGATRTSPAMLLNFVSNSHMRNVRFKDCGDEGLYGRVLWNYHFENCWWTDCGTNSGKAGLYLGSHPSIDQGTNTVQFSNCEWEGCGDAVLVDGPDPSPRECVATMFVNCKLERNTGSCFKVRRVHGFIVQNSYIHASDNANPTIEMGGGSGITASHSGNSVIGNHIVSAGATAHYHVDCVAGQGHLINSNTFFGGTGAGAMVRLQTNVLNVCVLGNLQPSWHTDVPTVVDNRTNKNGSLILNASGTASTANGQTP
jgi:hypothetical protein